MTRFGPPQASVLNTRDAPSGKQKPGMPTSVLFLCGQNAIRSPMAEVLARKAWPRSIFWASAGVRAGERDPFVDAVLEEAGLSLGDRQPRAFDQLEDSYFDLIVTLSPEAHHAALELTRSLAVDVEYWPTLDPTTVRGTREQILAAYRDVRDRLAARIAARFAPGGEVPPE
jgi:protein-tyrosine-phosphatase